MLPRVSICTVTHNAVADLPDYFAALLSLTHRPIDVIIADCASTDASVEVAREFSGGPLSVHVLALGENRGFAGGMNAAIAASDAPFVLSLNADARPEPAFLTHLMARMDEPGWRVGAATGRLLRPLRSDGTRLLDACGMRLVPTWRHLDRASGKLEGGQFARAERVFGGTGAATLLRREALLDTAVDGDVFDPEFFTFREDAELCFRLRERGWEVIYEPLARCEHRRFNVPERRSTMPAWANMHSLKNRYLLRAYHQTPRNFALTFLPTLWRDSLALGAVIFRERSSLPAYRWLWTNRRRIRARRAAIQARRTIAARELDPWFFRSGAPL
ncbi:MAG: glycosyltransferase [Acidobacteriota bacterium]